MASTISDFEIGFDVHVEGVDSAVLQMHTMIPEVRAALEVAVRKEADQILGRARELASGGVIQVRTGDFLRSLESRVKSSDESVFGYVWSDDPDLAAVFEFGGVQQPRDILPNVAEVLHFMESSGEVFASIVHRPTVVYEPKPIIHAAFDEARNEVEDRIGDAILTGIYHRTLDQTIDAGARSHNYSAE